MVRTAVNTQQEIISFYSKALGAKGVKVTKTSRHGKQLRFDYREDPEKLLNSIHPCSLKVSNATLSGQFITRELILNADLGEAKKGSQCYVVVTVRATGIIKSKELTPDKLGLGGKVISVTSFKRIAQMAIDKSSTKDNIKQFLKDLMDASEQSMGHIKPGAIDTITDSDLNVIAKDFGEISGAIWFSSVHNTKVDSIEYPRLSNLKLIDYYAIIGRNQKIAVSAKANEGAPPSIDTIADVLDKTRFQDSKKEAARHAIIAIRDNNVTDGIIAAAKYLKTPGYEYLKKKFRRDFKSADVENFLSKYKTPKQFFEDFAGFYKLIGREASEQIAQRLFLNKGRRFGLVISPLGYSLVDTLNRNHTFLSVLNNAAKKIDATQLYMKINKSAKRVEYRVKEFNESDFLFKYNANAGAPGLKKISFVMKK